MPRKINKFTSKEVDYIGPAATGKGYTLRQRIIGVYWVKMNDSNYSGTASLLGVDRRMLSGWVKELGDPVSDAMRETNKNLKDVIRIITAPGKEKLADLEKQLFRRLAFEEKVTKIRDEAIERLHDLIVKERDLNKVANALKVVNSIFSEDAPADGKAKKTAKPQNPFISYVKDNFQVPKQSEVN